MAIAGVATQNRSCCNADASPDDPIAEWPAEAIQTALERGSLRYWRRLAEAMERVIADARETAEADERRAVAAEISRLVDESGLTRAEFASRIGTSASRLSTYVDGKVTPSASLLLRMKGVTDGERERAGQELLTMPPSPGPETDWEEQKREMLNAQADRRPDASPRPGADRPGRRAGGCGAGGLRP